MLGGHPRALSTLFFTEMWERFTFYGMRALLVLFLVDAVESGGYGFDDKTATAIYGLYTAAVFMAALPGGWIADRLIGAQRAVMAGGWALLDGLKLVQQAGPKQVFTSNQFKIAGLASTADGKFLFVDGFGGVYRTSDFVNVETLLQGGRPYTDAADLTPPTR